MFQRFFGPSRADTRDVADVPSTDVEPTTGETATVRRIVARLEAMSPEQARLAASTAYTLARAGHADLDISAEETARIEHELQASGLLDEPTAVLVTEMAKLQAGTVGGTEDYPVTREFRDLASVDQRVAVLRACFAVAAASGTISAEETAVLSQIANELSLEPAAVTTVRSEFRDQSSAVHEVRRLAGRG